MIPAWMLYLIRINISCTMIDHPVIESHHNPRSKCTPSASSTRTARRRFAALEAPKLLPCHGINEHQKIFMMKLLLIHDSSTLRCLKM